MMQSELAAVRGVVALTPREVIAEGQVFLARQGYATVELTETSLTVQRLPHGGVSGTLPSLTITAIPDPQGGVRVIVSGDDRDGVQRNRDAWMEWSERLPRTGENREPDRMATVTRTQGGEPSTAVVSRQPAAHPAGFSTARNVAAAPEVQQPFSTRRMVEMVVGGAVAVLVVLAVLLFALLMFVPMGGADSDGSSESGSAGFATGAGVQSGSDDGGGQRTVGVGEQLNVGDVSWTVTDARQASEMRQRGFGKFGETKQGNFVIVDFDFTNDGSEAVTLDTMSLALVDGEGRKSEADTDTFGYVPEGKDIFLENVNPGTTRQGQVIFTVAPGASDFKLEAGDTDMFSDEKGFVELGF